MKFFGKSGGRESFTQARAEGKFQCFSGLPREELNFPRSDSGLPGTC